MSTAYTIALCGITARDERMIHVVLGHMSSTRFVFKAVSAATLANGDIALVDPLAAEGRAQCEALRRRNPRLVTVALTDVGTNVAGAYGITRRTLCAQLVPTLEDVVRVEFLGDTQHERQTRVLVAPSTATPVAEATVEGSPFRAGNADGTPYPYGPLRALIVDDSITVRNQLEAALTRIGIQADHASNAESAYLMLGKRPYDLMLLDVVMPGTDGYEICRTVRRQPATKQLPVLMLTSRSSPFDRARGALAGCDQYLTKPIDLKTFYQAIDKVVMKLFKNDTGAAHKRGYLLATG
jgi:two-component system cell cycle response regulator